jgi:hypothetical protein
MRVSLNRREDVVRIRFTEFSDADVAREYEVVEHNVRGDFALLFDTKGVVLGIDVKFASIAFPAGFLDSVELE